MAHECAGVVFCLDLSLVSHTRCQVPARPRRRQRKYTCLSHLCPDYSRPRRQSYTQRKRVTWRLTEVLPHPSSTLPMVVDHVLNHDNACFQVNDEKAGLKFYIVSVPIVVIAVPCNWMTRLHSLHYTARNSP